jgi:hypothetical protein
MACWLHLVVSGGMNWLLFLDLPLDSSERTGIFFWLSFDDHTDTHNWSTF